MRDRKRRSKTKNGVFRSGLFDQKKIYRFSQDKIVFFFLIEKSKSKNAVFRFRSRIRSGLRVVKVSGTVMTAVYVL